MGTSTISSVDKAFVPVQSAGGSTGSREEVLKAAFADVMGRMSSMVGQGSQNQNGYPGVSAPVESVRGTDRAYDRHSYHKLDVRESSRRQDVSRDELTEKVDDFAKDVRDVLKDELDVSDDEIEKAMEQLGLTFADLLDPRQLAALVAELTGAQDMGALLCNSDFLDVMHAVDELGADLLKELGLTAEELKGMLEAAANQEPVDISGFADGISTLDAAAQKAETLDAAQETPVAVQTAASEKTKEMSSEDETLHAAGENSQAADENAPVDKKEETPDSGGQNLHQQNTHTEHGENIAAGQAIVETPVAQGTEETAFASQLDTSNIIRQIVEFAKVSTTNMATTVELQLNPEHLGKVFLELTSKNGMVSAHLTTQNEVAKEALESQLVELRQNLTQAGVKVEAVEVTVGSHEFERNLEQNAKQDEQQAEQQEKAAKQTRRINLNDLDELVGVMSEEENLVAQMMAEQGNSIDYTA